MYKASIISLGLASLAIFGLTYIAYDDQRPRMRDLSWANGLDHPTAMSITRYIAIPFPLAQEIGAVWVDRSHSQLIVLYAEGGLKQRGWSAEKRTLFQSYYDKEVDRLAKRIGEKQPDIIIRSLSPADKELYNEIVRRNPHLLDAYEAIAQEGVIQIMKRRTEGENG